MFFQELKKRPLPSPSAMKWHRVHHFLVGPVPHGRKDNLVSEESVDKVQVPWIMVENLTLTAKYFSDKSEMEANMRVALLVMGAICCDGCCSKYLY